MPRVHCIPSSDVLTFAYSPPCSPVYVGTIYRHAVYPDQQCTLVLAVIYGLYNDRWRAPE